MPRKRRDLVPEIAQSRFPERLPADTDPITTDSATTPAPPTAPPREIERLLTWVADSAQSTRTRLDAAEALVRWAAEHLDHPAAHLVAPAIEYVEAVADHAVTSEPTDRVRAAVLLLEVMS